MSVWLENINNAWGALRTISLQNNFRMFLRNAFALVICEVQYIYLNTTVLVSYIRSIQKDSWSFPFYLVCIKIDTQGPQSILLMNIMTPDVSFPRESFQCFLLIRQMSWLQEFFKRSWYLEHLFSNVFWSNNGSLPFSFNFF